MKKKNLIFIGAPGSGKGTIAGLLLKEYPLAHISTGDILRAEIKKGTALGLEASEIMKAGKLVSDDIVINMIKARLQEADCDNGFILDGFPRTLNQAQMLDELLKTLNKEIDAIIYFNVEDEVLISRLTSRLTCKSCGAVFNKLYVKPKVEGVCDECQGELIQRADDSLETAKNRLKVFYDQTHAAIEYYGNSGKMIELSSASKEEIMARLKMELC